MSGEHNTHTHTHNSYELKELGHNLALALALETSSAERTVAKKVMSSGHHPNLSQRYKDVISSRFLKCVLDSLLKGISLEALSDREMLCCTALHQTFQEQKKNV